jgi:hypothetical protein
MLQKSYEWARASRPFFISICLLAFAGCGKAPSSDSRAKESNGSTPVIVQTPSASPAQEAPKFDACALITKEEIQAIQDSPIIDVKSSGNSEGEFEVSQCFYTAKEYSRSVSLAVTQSNPGRPGNRTPKDFWKETFGRFSGDEAASEKEKKETPAPGREKGEEEKSIPPKKIDGLGDEAYWTGNRLGGALYVLKKNSFIRVAVGGPDSQEMMITKTKALAEKALSRL